MSPRRVKAGNLYVNRNIIGAVVGVQPFGGRGLSGTGPKAGGPLYLGRLVHDAAGAAAAQLGAHRSGAARFRQVAGWQGPEGGGRRPPAKPGSQSALGLDDRACRPGRRAQSLCPACARPHPARAGDGTKAFTASLPRCLPPATRGHRCPPPASKASLAGPAGHRRRACLPAPGLGGGRAVCRRADRRRCRAHPRGQQGDRRPARPAACSSRRHPAKSLPATPDAYCLNWLLEEVSTSDQHGGSRRQCEPDVDRVTGALATAAMLSGPADEDRWHRPSFAA